MIDWLYSLPEPLVLVMSAGTLAFLITILPPLVHRIPGMEPNEARTDFIMRIQTPVFTITSVVLAFTLVQADINFRQIDSLVSTEASQINQLDRLLTRYGHAAVSELRPALLTYARSIVNDEWPAMLRGHGNDATAQAFAPISRGILAINPSSGRQAQIFGEMLKQLDAAAESRAARLKTLSVGLPAIYWQVVLFGVAMLLFISSTVEQTVFRAAVLAAQMAVLGAFIGFVFLMDQPFQGTDAVNPDAITQVITTIEARHE